MKQQWRISPSAVAKSSPDCGGCERKYQLDMIVPRGEDTEKQALGQELHAVQEAYLNTGKAHDRTTRAGRMALAGLPYMPAPRTGRAEGETELVISGIRYVIYADYAGPSDLIPGAPKGLPATIDHKTSSNPSEYGLWGDEAFLADPQALTYSARMLIKHPDASHVFNRWIYYDTRRKSVAKPSDAVMRREDVVQRFGDIVHPRAVRLVVLQNQRPSREAPEAERMAWANTLAPNLGACEKYGGCAHARTGACKLTAEERASACLASLNETKTINSNPAPRPAAAVEVEMSATEDLFAKLSAGLKVGGAAPVAPAVPANVISMPAPAAKPAAPAASDALAMLQAAAVAGRPSAPSVPAVPKVDLVNPPEKPEVKIPPKGADLVAHLQAKGAPADMISSAKERTAPASEVAEDVARVAAAKRPSTPPKAAPAKVSAEASKAKLDAMLGEVTDEELGRALRVLGRYIVSVLK